MSNDTRTDPTTRRALLGALPVLVFCVAVVTGSAGCSKPDPRAMLEGNWRVRPTSAVAQGVRMTDDNTTRAEARALGEYLGSFTLEFRPDDTFTLNMGPTPLVGKWTLEGEKVAMNVTTMAGRSLPPGGQQALSGELDPRLKVLNVEFSGGGAGQIPRLVFEKPDR